MIRFLKMLGGTLTAAALFACGGGGGNPGVNPQNPGGTTAPVADIALFMDKTTITNSGSDQARLTVLAVDANRNVVANAPVTVTADQNGVFQPTGPTTDATGTYTGVLSIGGDKRDRDITLTVMSNGISKTTSVRVSGSKLTLAATPSAPVPGQAVQLTATLVDAAGNPIPNVTVNLGGTVGALQNRTLTTNITGQATTSFTAPLTAGGYNISASGNGVTASEYNLQVFSSTVPAAVIPSGVTPSLSASPNVLSVNNPGTTTNRSSLRFLFLDSTNTPIQNVRVRFDDRTVGLAAVGASIASGSNVLYTDAAGTVTTDYIAGQNSSPTNGVTVRACYSANDFASSTDCPNAVTASLTVAGQALSVSIGDDNTLSRGTGNLTYIKRFAVTVADSAGRAVADAPIDISVDLTHYSKGQFAYGSGAGSYTYLDDAGNPISPLTAVPLSLTSGYPTDLTATPASLLHRVWCPNEDTNRNGNVDPGENRNGSTDSNGQATLEPRTGDLLISYDTAGQTRTNSSGVLVIKVEYAQRFGTWLAYKVRVTANVSGSQGMAERLFVTDVLEDDVENGAFLTPAYGVGSCSQPN